MIWTSSNDWIIFETAAQGSSTCWYPSANGVRMSEPLQANSKDPWFQFKTAVGHDGSVPVDGGVNISTENQSVEQSRS